jgi:hypothetical protein
MDKKKFAHLVNGFTAREKGNRELFRIRLAGFRSRKPVTPGRWLIGAHVACAGIAPYRHFPAIVSR